MVQKKKKEKKQDYEDDPTVSPASYVFWEDFYDHGEGSGESYEWYVCYQHIRDILLKTIKPDLNKCIKEREKEKEKEIEKHYQILHVGCGNSLIAEELLLDLEENRLLNVNILNIDVCSNAIERMIQRQQSSIVNKRIKQCLKYEVMDATDTKLPDNHFNGIIDKGTIDALLSTLEVEVGENEMVKKLLSEMYRILKPGGYLVVVSRNTCAEPYFYMEEEIEWSVTTTPLNINSTKGKGILQVNYIYTAIKPLLSTNTSSLS